VDATLLRFCELGGLASTLAVDALSCLYASYATCSRSNLSLFESICSSKLRNFSSASRLLQSHFFVTFHVCTESFLPWNYTHASDTSRVFLISKCISEVVSLSLSLLVLKAPCRLRCSASCNRS
jgi:hypothetical protein